MIALKLKDPSLQLRVAEQKDENILFQIYSTSYAAATAAPANLDEEQKRILLELQFKAQNHYYHQNFTAANFWVLEKEGRVIGLLYLDVQNNPVRIINIALLKEYRNKGIGSKILKDILNFANDNGRSVLLQVQTSNPVFHLYQRLGFEIVNNTTGIYYMMEYNASKKPIIT